MRKCKTCTQEFEEINFESVSLKGKIHLRGSCRECVKIKRREKYRLNPEKYAKQCKLHWDNKGRDAFKKKYHANRNQMRAKARIYNNTAKGRAYTLWKNAKRRSGDEFNVSRARIERLIEVGFCQKSGIAFDLTPSVDGNQKPLSPSIDRIDRNGSYTDDNVQIVLWCYNMGKGIMTDEQFIEFCKQVVKYNA